MKKFVVLITQQNIRLLHSYVKNLEEMFLTEAGQKGKLLILSETFSEEMHMEKN